MLVDKLLVADALGEEDLDSELEDDSDSEAEDERETVVETDSDGD